MKAMKPKTWPKDVKPLAGGEFRQHRDEGYPGLGVNSNTISENGPVFSAVGLCTKPFSVIITKLPAGKALRKTRRTGRAQDAEK